MSLTGLCVWPILSLSQLSFEPFSIQPPRPQSPFLPSFVCLILYFETDLELGSWSIFRFPTFVPLPPVSPLRLLSTPHYHLQARAAMLLARRGYVVVRRMHVRCVSLSAAPSMKVLSINHISCHSRICACSVACDQVMQRQCPATGALILVE